MMKKGVVVIGLLLGLNGSVFADCSGKRINGFVVSGASFSKVSVRDAVGQLLYGTPFRVEVDSDVTKLVSATGVSGPLGGVLRRFSEQSGLQVRVDDCSVRVSSRVAASNADFFVETVKPAPVVRPASSVSGRFLSDD